MAQSPSTYQSAIYHFIEHGSGNGVVNAVAGSGKSTTLVNGLRVIDPRKTVLLLAFNKDIVTELKTKIGNQPNVRVSTLHGLGLASINFTLWDCEVNANKYRAKLNELVRENYFSDVQENLKEDFSQFKRNILQLVDLCRLNLVNDKIKAKDLAKKHDIFLYDEEIKWAFRLIKWGLSEESEIDFTDMIFFPVIKKMRVEKYDWVFIDECQDLNACQRELFLMSINQVGRFLAVGDPKQAIYGFAGADVLSFNLLKALPDTQLFPLSVCYRCDAAIIRLAQTIIPQIECREGAPEGEVEINSSLHDVKDGDMILCRLTAPVVDVCMRYISGGTKAYIKGKDIGANLINMISETNRDTMEQVFIKLERELSRVLVRASKDMKCSLQEAKESEEYLTYVDKVDAIRIIADDIVKAEYVINRIKGIFLDNSSGIALSTIHRSKGLECDRVFILCPDKLFHAPAMTLQWSAEQEENLVYVAYTRAKHYLGFIRDYEWGGVKKVS